MSSKVFRVDGWVKLEVVAASKEEAWRFAKELLREAVGEQAEDVGVIQAYEIGEYTESRNGED